MSWQNKSSSPILLISKMGKSFTCGISSYSSTHSNSERPGLEFKGGAKGDAKDIGNGHIKGSLKSDVKFQNIQ